MPYQKERANKASHYDLINSVDIQRFLGECDYLKLPSDDERDNLAASFQPIPLTSGISLPAHVLATDGSYYEASLSDQLPSTKVGYVKIGCILIDLAEYHSLRVDDNRFVDPFRVAALQEHHDALAFPLPSANIKYKGKESVRDGFRAAVDDYLYSTNTRFDPNNPATSLRATLFHLAAKRPTPLLHAPGTLILHKCPSCGHKDVVVSDTPNQQVCPDCHREVYPADCLRLWETVTDNQSNVSAISRFMMVVEHMMPIHYIRYLMEHSPSSLNEIAFFVDGPLAIFGETAWLHASIMRYLAEVNQHLTSSGGNRLLMIGLQKSGQVVDYVNFIKRFLPSSCLMAIDDEYRYRYIHESKDPSSNGFGYETYYGQDFIYQTSEGRSFVFGMPYPFATKTGIPGNIDFRQEKTNISRYSELARALSLIDHFQCDLYEDAVVPVALAHRYTSISLVPGGRVLDLLTRRALSAKAQPSA